MSRPSSILLLRMLLSFAPVCAQAQPEACEPAGPASVGAGVVGALASEIASEAQSSDPAVRLVGVASQLGGALTDSLDRSATETLRSAIESLLSELEAIPPSPAAIDAMLQAGSSLEPLTESTSLVASLYRRAAESAATLRDARRRSTAEGRLALLYVRGERWDDARTLLRRALFQATLADAPELTFRWQWKLAQVERVAGNDDASLAGLRQAVATLRTLDPQSLALEARDTLGDEAPSHAFRELVDQLLARAARTADESVRQSLLREAQDVLESFKVRELRDYFRDACLDLQPRVAPDEIPGALVLYPISLPDRLEIIVRRQGRFARYVSPVGEQELRATIDRLRRGLERRASFGFRADAERVYDWIVRPVEMELARLGPSDVLVFVPDGPLRTIPMAALRDRESGQYLIERFPVAITPGLTLTEPRSIDWPEASVLAVGMTEAQEGFPALAHVDDEIAQVRETFTGVRLLDGSFSPKELEQQLSERAFDIVHIASHGEFSSDAASSFILTHEGRLTMDRLSSIVGVTRFRERSLELLTLSACQTAAGDDRAALGLAGVAVQAGARSALASLWSVDDAGAALLVSSFYGNLHRDGASRATALQQAQLKMLRETSYRHPAFWSAFVLINNWL